MLFPQSLNFSNLNNDITEILNSMDIYVLPVVNPDGYKYTWTTVKNKAINKMYRNWVSGCVPGRQHCRRGVDHVVLIVVCYLIDCAVGRQIALWSGQLISHDPVRSGMILQCSQSGMLPVPPNMSIWATQKWSSPRALCIIWTYSWSRKFTYT